MCIAEHHISSSPEVFFPRLPLEGEEGEDGFASSTLTLTLSRKRERKTFDGKSI
jgi:hypothetical protein